MPKGQKRSLFQLPDKLKIEVVNGEKFVQLRAAAQLAGIHPAILEMGQRLLKAPNGQGGVFVLGTDAMIAKATDIEEAFRVGLKRVARALGTKGLTVKSYFDRDGERLVFWYDVWGPAVAKAAKDA